MHRGLWILGIFVFLGALPLPLPALDFPPLGQALKQSLPAGDKAFQTTLKVDADQAKTLGGGYRAGETFTVYYTKNASGAVSGRAVELKEILVKYGVLHRWVVGLKADGTLAGVTVTKLGDAHAYPVADAKFQAQFAGKSPQGLALGSGLDAMTGATESCQLLVDSVGRAVRILGWADCR
jgi:Na+-translocating ferredoxin:NAD+ oxidoreductase RnfG subunit